MQVFLKAGNMRVEPENFRGKRVLAGKFLCALDTPLPGRDGHWAIISSVQNWGNLLRGNASLCRPSYEFCRRPALAALIFTMDFLSWTIGLSLLQTSCTSPAQWQEHPNFLQFGFPHEWVSRC
jgi:hypothetical protein